jgi:sugar (pentulose or hexulose) kinase
MAGTVSAGAAGAIGLACGTPVIVGSSDGTTAMYGAGILDEGRAVLVCGTTDVLMTCSVTKPANPGRELCVNSGMMPDSYLVGGPLGLSGGSLQYFERLLQVKASQLESKIRNLSPGSDGLLLFPGLTGERSPYWQAHLSGALIGLKPDHRAEHILRAVIEGCALRILRLLKILAINDLHPHTLNTVGGGSRSDVWNQIRSDASGLVVQKMSVAEATCLGTALYWQTALDPSRTLREIAGGWIKVAKRFKPDPEHTRTYQKLAGLFEKHIESNSDLYKELDDFRQQVSTN